MRTKAIQVAVIVLLAAAALTGQSALKPATARAAAVETADTGKTESAPYIVQPNDVLEIFVWKEPDLTRKVLVRPDGRISFPLVQDLQAAGMTTAELKSQIEARLEENIRLPNVTVIVDAIQSYKVFVTGKVQKPGEIRLEKPITVLQALALAGNFQEFSNLTEITIIRDTGADRGLFKFNYEEVVKGKNPAQNIRLKTGDVVVVP